MITAWLNDAKEIKGVTGVMYTTWRNNFSHTKEFVERAGVRGSSPSKLHPSP
jgi:hypothetical protein